MDFWTSRNAREDSLSLNVIQWYRPLVCIALFGRSCSTTLSRIIKRELDLAVLTALCCLHMSGFDLRALDHLIQIGGVRVAEFCLVSDSRCQANVGARQACQSHA
jgi:hypothetical protein